MSISGTMSSALSGLNAAARSADLISSNIANALTEGYGRRELLLSARQAGATVQGVQVVGVLRQKNQVLMSESRFADATSANLSKKTDFLASLATAYGLPDDASSLAGRFASFEAALISGAGEPGSMIRLSNVVETARSLTTGFRAIASEIQFARGEADTQIGNEVGIVNRALISVSDLNKNIAITAGNGRDASALLDQRQSLIDQIATIIPLREVQGENGKVSLYSTGGATLLDHRPATLSFRPVGLITPDMTLGSGALSGLQLNGRPVGTALVGGGSLAAGFAIRDDLTTAAQIELDAVARDLISRFQDAGLDPTLAPADAGLFTDNGSAFSISNELGIAARIGLNAALDPDAGGYAWRARDGLGATSAGAVGDSRLLSAMQAALNDARFTESGQFSGSAHSMTSLSGQVLSAVTNAHLHMENEADFSAARATALQRLVSEEGIDTDRELQDLLLIEQAYAANAKVIQTADDLIQILLGM
jgi:flagellar hook-associated protein 1